MPIKEISEIAEGGGLDNVDPVGIIERLEVTPSHCRMKKVMNWTNNKLNSRRKVKMSRIVERKQCR